MLFNETFSLLKFFHNYLHIGYKFYKKKAIDNVMLSLPLTCIFLIKKIAYFIIDNSYKFFLFTYR